MDQEGRVVVRTLIGTDGLALRADIWTSSGHQTLDNAAREAVLGWCYVPGKRNGVPETMWLRIPINFVLD